MRELAPSSKVTGYRKTFMRIHPKVVPLMFSSGFDFSSSDRRSARTVIILNLSPIVTSILSDVRPSFPFLLSILVAVGHG
jgi:hypothetical protein